MANRILYIEAANTNDTINDFHYLPHALTFDPSAPIIRAAQYFHIFLGDTVVQNVQFTDIQLVRKAQDFIEIFFSKHMHSLYETPHDRYRVFALARITSYTWTVGAQDAVAFSTILPLKCNLHTMRWCRGCRMLNTFADRIHDIRVQPVIDRSERDIIRKRKKLWH